MLSKQKAPPLSKNSTKAGKQESQDCPNPMCQHQFLTSCPLKIHFAKTTACTDALLVMADNKIASIDVVHGKDPIEVDEQSSYGCQLDIEDSNVNKPSL